MRFLNSLRAHAVVLAAAGALAALGVPANAAYNDSTPDKTAASPDYIAGLKAIDAKQWTVAADAFRRMTLQDPKNADAWNMLGYSSRSAGNYAEAFSAYARALALDPHHRGAHSYLGVAYVRTDNLVKAREQLAKLEGICGKTCDEYRQLQQAIDEYKLK